MSRLALPSSEPVELGELLRSESSLKTAGRTGAGTPGVLVSMREPSCCQRCQTGHSNSPHRNDTQPGG